MFKKRLTYFPIVICGMLFFATIVMAAALDNPLTGVTNFGQLITKIADVAGSMVAGVSILMFIIAGILFMISAGSPERVQSAKSALFYAIIGAVIALAAKGLAAALTGILGI